MLTDASLGPFDWSFDPTVVSGLAAVAILYVAAFRRGILTSADDVGPWFESAALRPWFFAGGLGVALVALQSPIDTGGDRYLLSLHMVQHLLLMMVAPPLALLGIAGMRPAFADAPRWMSGVLQQLARPWTATVLFNVVLLVWHLPGLYNTTLTNDGLHVFEHITFAAVGVAFWWPIVDPLRTQIGRSHIGPFTKIAMLVAAGVPPTVLGFVLSLSPSASYDFYAAAPRLWGFSPVADQQLAGVIMLGLGNLVYFAAISVVFLRLFGDDGGADEEAAAAFYATRSPTPSPERAEAAADAPLGLRHEGPRPTGR